MVVYAELKQQDEDKQQQETREARWILAVSDRERIQTRALLLQEET